MLRELNGRGRPGGEHLSLRSLTSFSLRDTWMTHKGEANEYPFKSKSSYFIHLSVSKKSQRSSSSVLRIRWNYLGRKLLGGSNINSLKRKSLHGNGIWRVDGMMTATQVIKGKTFKQIAKTPLTTINRCHWRRPRVLIHRGPAYDFFPLLQLFMHFPLRTFISIHLSFSQLHPAYIYQILCRPAH